MTSNPRLIITLPKGLKRVVIRAAEHRNCSQAEIIKSALYEHLRDFLVEDNTTHKSPQPRKDDGGR